MVFEHLDLVVEAGEFVALTGESGSGKSTLLHLLALLDRVTAGSISLNGRELCGLTDNEAANVRNREFGFVWQMNTLLPEFTALENVMMPLLVRGVSRANAGSAAGRRLEEVGLRARAHHRSGELSGGEQQRVALARALVGEPRLLFADEPTGNLDDKTGVKVMEVLEELHRTHRLTTLFVTHHPGFAARAGRRLELAGGRIHKRS